MSFYNPALDALFIHVPKTAGTSIKRTGLFLGGKHETIRDFDVPENTFKFAFVRDPWDRFVSALFFQKDYQGKGQKDFDQFIQEECVPCLESGKTPRQSAYISAFDPMYHFLLDKEGMIGVDYVGYYENLRHHWEVICAILNVHAPLPHYRKYEHDYYKRYYTPESWDIVGKIYKKDVDLFNYGSVA